MVTTLDDLLALRADLVAMEPGPRFLGLPDRWYEAPGPLFRCTSGHVSTCVLKSEVRGDQCLACYAPVVLTFPEDIDDPAPTAPTSPGFLAFAEAMAQGPCLCAEIAEQDRPCLTCEAQAVLAQRGAS